MSTTKQPTNTSTKKDAAAPITSGAWRLDPARSSVAFHVRHFYGVMTVKGGSPTTRARWASVQRRPSS